MEDRVRYHVQASDDRFVAFRSMPSSALTRPDVLVLAGGGIVGEAWMHGVLAGIEDASDADFTATEAFVGTSAGSIVAARLASGRRPPRPDGGGSDAEAAAPGLAEEAGGGERGGAFPLRAAQGVARA